MSNFIAAREVVKLMQDVVATEGDVVLSKEGGFFADGYDKVVLEAIEKQIPQKPKIIERLSTGYVHWVCPRCKTPYVSPLPRHCSLCGQRIHTAGDE